MPRFLRGRTMTNAWREPGDAVSLEDAAVAGRFAREAANPFGRKLAARDLLARFGGDTPDGRRRARAALELAGVAAEPPLENAEPHQFVALRPAAPTVAQAHAAEGEATPVVQVVPSRRRFAIGALGLAGLAVVLVAAVLMRSFAGDGGEDAAMALSTTETTPATTAPAATTPAPATDPRRPAAAGRPRTAARPEPEPGTGTRPAPRSDAAARSAPEPGTGARPAPGPDPAASPRTAQQPLASPRPRQVRLRIAATERSYVCVAEDDGTTIYDGFVVESRPLVVTRPRVRFRIGVGTARITANQRAIPVNVAPSGYRVGPSKTRQLPLDDPVCGAS